MKIPKLANVIQWGLLAILAVMPVHAFLSVWFGNTFGNQAVFQAWKEALLLVLSILAVLLVLRDRTRLAQLRQPWVLGAAGFMAIGLLVTAFSHPDPISAAFGLKTDFEFLLAGIIAALVSDKLFLQRVLQVLLVMAAVVAGFDLLQIYVLPPDFLTFFGYGPDTILPYQHIAAGTSALRFPSTLGGPNQLGTYLILPICVTAALFVKRRRPWQAALFAACVISLIWTFSRSAWLGAAAALAITILAVLPARLRRPAAVAGGLVLIAALLILPVAVAKGGQLQYFILHSSVASHDQSDLSDSQHAQSLSDGLNSVLRQPLGHGLGTAGPATFHEGEINIIENYYLQIGYEAGLAGLALFVYTIITLILALAKRARLSPMAVPVAASLIGISLVAIVLPAWVDSTTALIAWIMAGGVAGLPLGTKHV